MTKQRIKMVTKKWYGPKPIHCQACKNRLGLVFYDASIKGTWALICSSCFAILEPTIGQKYNALTLDKMGDI
jgi:hypothetical protein